MLIIVSLCRDIDMMYHRKLICLHVDTHAKRYDLDICI